MKDLIEMLGTHAQHTHVIFRVVFVVNRNFPGKILNFAVSFHLLDAPARAIFPFVLINSNQRYQNNLLSFSGNSGDFRNVLFTFQSRQLILF